MTRTVSVTLDAPDLEAGIRLCRAAFGLTQRSPPVAGVAVLAGAGTGLCLLPSGSPPAPDARPLSENPARGSAAFCSDPCGHGLCLLERRPRSHAGA